MLNSRGPKTDLWGTPRVTFVKELNDPFTLTLCCLFVRSPLISVNQIPTGLVYITCGFARIVQLLLAIEKVSS